MKFADVAGNKLIVGNLSIVVFVRASPNYVIV